MGAVQGRPAADTPAQTLQMLRIGGRRLHHAADEPELFFAIPRGVELR